MDSIDSQLVKPLRHSLEVQSLRIVNDKHRVQETMCSKYIEPLDAVAAGEHSNNNSDTRNALVTLTSLDPGRKRKNYLAMP